jgi:legumain
VLIDQVKNRTAYMSNVMQYGDLGLNAENLDLFMGSSDPVNGSATDVGGGDNSLTQLSRPVLQRDADLVYLWQKVSNSVI